MVVIGLAAVSLAFVVAAWKWREAAEVATALGSVTGVIGTVVGAYFGMQIGAAGKRRAEEERRQAEQWAMRAAGALPPEVAERMFTERWPSAEP